MLRVLQLLLVALVLVLVALVSALTAMRIAIHGREVDVPKLVGLTPADAEAALGERGLSLQLEDRFYSINIPEGRILSQSPQAGSVVRRGWRVRVAESLGMPRAKVPNVIGQSGRAAEINVRRRGLEVGKVSIIHLPNLVADQVIAMSPPPETIGNSPRVSLLLTAPEEEQTLVMPNLVGKRMQDASKLIDQAGLRLGKINQTTRGSSTTQTETIIRQFPGAGSKITPGIPVALEVAQ